MREAAVRYLSGLKGVIDGLPLDAMDSVAERLYEAYQNDSTIFIMGNGGSGSTASHFACDINKGACFEKEKRFRVICLNDNIPTMLAYANDNSYEDIFVEQLKNFVEKGDLVIGISGSGNSENVVRAVCYANERGAETIAMTGFGGGRLAVESMFSLVVPSDDMQKVEDLHLIITHIFMQILYAKVAAHSS